MSLLREEREMAENKLDEQQDKFLSVLREERETVERQRHEMETKLETKLERQRHEMETCRGCARLCQPRCAQ